MCHLASWAGMAPGSNITGGKRRSGKTTKGDKWLGEILNQCAWSAARARDTYLSAQFWRLAHRIGKKKATVAVGQPLDPGHLLAPRTCSPTTATTKTLAATTSYDATTPTGNETTTSDNSTPRLPSHPRQSRVATRRRVQG